MKYKEDWRSIGFVSITLLMLILPLTIELTTWESVLWVATSSLLCFIVTSINHNHTHNSVFLSSTYNQIYAVLLSLCTGFPSSSVIASHIYNHHVYQGAKEDCLRTEIAGRGYGFIRIARFVINALRNITQMKVNNKLVELSQSKKKSLLIEKNFLIIFALLTLVFFTDDVIVFIYIPWFIGVVMIIGVNLLQHDGCQPSSEFNHSRNFTGGFANWLFFNTGYHTAHHEKCSAHWSELPSIHDRIKINIKEALNQKSIMKFLITHYTISKKLPHI